MNSGLNDLLAAQDWDTILKEYQYDEIAEEVQKAYRERREMFLKARTEQELEVLEFGKSVKANMAAFEGKLEIPEEITLQALTPELYKENPDVAVYEEQYAKASEFMKKVEAIILGYLKEANACMQRYKEISSGGQS